MKLKSLLLVLVWVCSYQSFAQTTPQEEVLFTVNSTPVSAKEFMRVYHKNLDLVQDESQKDVDTYLELFVNYKLKLEEAKTLGFDKKNQYVREFNSYKKQLAKNYMTDHKVTEALVKEAYDRVANDVKVSHILIRMEPGDVDTTAVYNQMIALGKRLKNEDFAKVQREVSNGKTVLVEDLGWFSGFKMIYDFETVAYNTPKGEVSKPFRTQFGYHVLKLYDKRPSKGEVSVGHIMIKNTRDDSADPKARIFEIYKLLQEGGTFESLAKQFSEDPSSASSGGKLKSFKSTQLSSVKFEDNAFALNEVGAYSAPFQTDYGWHIAKLYDKKAMPSFEEMQVSLESRVRRDPRSKVINEAFNEQLRTKYGLSLNNKALSYFESILNDSYFTQAWTIPSDLPTDKVLVNIKDKTLTYGNFASYLKTQEKSITTKRPFKGLVANAYKKFLNRELLRYHEANLENSNEDYAHVLNEYREGLLLFDLMETKVWNAVKNDTIALKNYYEDHQQNYQWPDRLEGAILSSSNKKNLQKAVKLLKKGTDIETIKQQLNAEEGQNLVVTSGTFEKNDRALPKGFRYQSGISKIYNHNDAFHVINVETLLPSTAKTFEEAKGKVISDYQNVYEANWLVELAKKYKVEINKNVLENVKAKIKG